MAMMMMMLRMETDYTEGCVFSLTEEKMHSDKRYEKAIKYIAGKKASSYVNSFDLLFGETFDRRVVLDYYDGKGSKLRDIASDKTILVYDVVLSKIMDICLHLWKTGQRMSWKEMVRLIGL